ncbi:pentapeptide repeat-containing protein [Bradyrhizobium sp. 190]|uniref:pentapeptide repeat-containing protein n=1 Tax=Bradyrhizobium sp. 190 TaxID=2782658 RepID=UPI0035ABB355|nr:pentapeptide repeat-containing protein [Bradyrhizobium sp. 190]
MRPCQRLRLRPEGAYAYGTYFSRAHFLGTILRGANCLNSDFQGAELVGSVGQSQLHSLRSIGVWAKSACVAPMFDAMAVNGCLTS